MNIFEWFKVILLGIVEGITEWLPISSTGHLILVNEFMHLKQSDAFMEMFDVVIQLGAILAVVVIFIQKLWPFHTKKKKAATSWFQKKATTKALTAFQQFCDNYCDMDKILLWIKIVFACIPAILIGLPLDDWMEEHFHNATVVALMLIVYGILFIILETYNKKRNPRITKLDKLSFKDAFLIGVFQVLSLIPGTSRSGSTIIGGILIGASREVAAEFTFFLAIPVMFGASFIKLLKFGLTFSSTELAVLIVGMLVAFAVSILAIKFLMGYIKKHDFRVFGWYRIILGIIVLLYFSLTNSVAFDASSYVQSCLDASYKGEVETYIQMTGSKKEDVLQSYEEFIASEVDSLENEYTLSDEQRQKFTLLFKKMYQTCKYEVGTATKQKDHSYLVPVTTSRLLVFGNFSQTIEQCSKTYYENNPNATAQEAYSAVIDSLYTHLEEKISNPKYEEPYTTSFSVTPTSDHARIYTIDTDALQKLVFQLLDLTEQKEDQSQEK